MITRRRAQYIVDEISGIIPQKINYIDAEGVIIASSEKERIGTKHTGVIKLISEGLEELKIISDDEFSGAKEGIVLPLRVRSKVVGAIAVSGEYPKIKPHVRIITKLVEILLLEDVQRQESRDFVAAKSIYISEWVHDEYAGSFEDFAERGLLLGIDVTIPRRIIFVNIKGKVESLETFAKKYEESKFEQSFFLAEKTYFIIGIPEMEDRSIKEYVKEIVEPFTNNEEICVRVGVDGRSRAEKDINKSYQEAIRAGKISSIKAGFTINFYNNIDLEIVMEDISDQAKKDYIIKVFSNIEEASIPELLRVLEIYYKYNGSIMRASQELYIHKNTLQKKLLRIADKTGKDPRSFQYAHLYSLAIYFFHSLKVD
ncbi:MAG TPA: helix-turn-helix domain-containing protein [Candidatus Dorea intestinavium]|nr:helix-turn-helix domain-containing protein [Candidatus Dorea intestinavium]